MPAETQNYQIKVRCVLAHNLESEIGLLSSYVGRFQYVAMDTEFPGVIFRPLKHHQILTPSERYSILKLNVDSLNLIQIGLTLSDSEGNLPGSETEKYIWEFNFKDFDIDRDACAADSIDLLKSKGIDFQKIKQEGIDSRDFTKLLMTSGLIMNENVKWVTFHSAYDFAYLIKILTGKKLPSNLRGFMEIVGVYFKEVFDMKHMMRYCEGLFGGLDRVSGMLKVGRVVGKSHQAGSDSLLTCHSFMRMRELYFKKDGGLRHAGVLFGLEYYQ